MKLALLATGGTIAGLGDSTRYTAAQLPAAALFATQPALADLCEWQIEQPFSLDSRDLTPQHWLQLAQRCTTLMQTPDIDGIVITHGSDTLEETAFALHLLLAGTKPVVLTAAMRPADAPDADGPAHLLQAARVALLPDARGHAPLVVAHGLILPAHGVEKCHTHALNALQAPHTGPLGQAGEHITLSPARSSHRPALALQAIGPLPRVDIIPGYAGQTGDSVDAAVASGARGLVIAAPGWGSISAALRPALRRAHAAGVQIIRASRVAEGGVSPQCNADDAAEGWIAAGSLNPWQARVLLILSLAASLPAKAIEAIALAYR